MRFCKFVFTASILLWLIACAGGTKSVPVAKTENTPDIALTDTLPVDPAIITGKLDNGITYYIKKNGKPENRCELRLAVNAGSTLEDDDQLGLAHFAEHMAFNGTEHFKKHELIDYLESIGMKFGPEINAYTSFDETVYMLKLPTDSLDVLRKGFQVLEDWAHLVSYEPEEIDKERGVIIEEWRLGRGADARMRDKQLPVLFKGSKYADRLPIGTKESLESFKHESLRRFYKDWYRPDLMAVIAVGDFDVEMIKKLITEKFGAFPQQSANREREMFKVPEHRETLYAIASDKEATRSTVSLFFKLPAQEEETVADYRLNIVENLFNNMFNERLEELTQQENPPFIYAYSGKGRFIRSGEIYNLIAMVKDNGLLLGLQVLLTEARRIQLHGFTTTELERQKKNVLRGMEQLFNERDKMESDNFANEYVRGFLYDEPLPGIAYEYQIYQKFVPTITLQEINALANQWITGENRVILTNCPQKEGILIPTEMELAQILAEAEKQTVEPYVDKAVEKPLVEKTPAPSQVIKKENIDKMGVTIWTLKNGVRVILKPTDFKNDEVLFSAFSYGGNSLVDDQDIIPAQTAATLMAQGGVSDFDMIQLQKLLSGKVVQVGPYISNLSEGMTGHASPKDIETLFQLIYLYFTAPRTDSTAYISYKTRIEAVYQNRSASPEAAFQDTLTSVITSHHPRYKPWSLATIKQFDLQKSAGIYKERFADGDDFTFLFVGNFTPEMIKPFVETYLGGLPVLSGKESWRDVMYEYPKGVIKRSLRRGQEAKSQDALIFTGPFDYNRQNRFIADAVIGVLRIKLRERIREDMGGTYGVRVSGSWAHFPKQRYQINIQLGANPQRVSEITKEIMTQIDSLVNFGTMDIYLTKIKEANRKEYETNLKENGFWLSNLEFKFFHSENPLDILTYPELIDKLTLTDIQDMAMKLFNKENYINLVLYPENWQE